MARSGRGGVDLDASLTRSAFVKEFFNPIVVSFATSAVPRQTPVTLRAGSGVKGGPTVFVGPFIVRPLTPADGSPQSRRTKRSFVLNQDSFAGTSAVTPFVGADEPAAIVEFSSPSNLTPLVPCHLHQLGVAHQTSLQSLWTMMMYSNSLQLREAGSLFSCPVTSPQDHCASQAFPHGHHRFSAASVRAGRTLRNQSDRAT